MELIYVSCDSRDFRSKLQSEELVHPKRFYTGLGEEWKAMGTHERTEGMNSGQ